MGRAVLLAYNDAKPAAVAAAEPVAQLIRAHGRLVGRASLISSPAHDSPPADLVAVVGGDGTLLAAARRFLGSETPIVGINAGRVGFMAAFDTHTIQAAAPALFGDAPLTTRAVRALRATIPGFPEPLHAVNDFVITAGPPYRMIALELSIDGRPGPVVRGDGLVIATPTGSTAHNVSAGGPILAPGLDAIGVAPIAAHSLSFRPFVLPAASEVRVRIIRGNDSDHAGTTLVADGVIVGRIPTGASLVVRGDGPALRFVLDPAADYWRTLMRKLRWAAEPTGTMAEPPAPPQ